MHGPGPKSTPAIGGGRVFTLGISGVLSAFDLATGKVLWRTPAAQPLPIYGTATSPLVDGDRVDRLHGRSRQGRVHGVRRGDRGGAMALDRGRPGLRVSGAGRARRDQAVRHAVAESPGRNQRRRRRTALAGAASDELRPELGDAAGGKRSCHLVRPPDTNHRLSGLARCLWVAGSGGLAKRAGVSVHELCRP